MLFVLADSLNCILCRPSTEKSKWEKDETALYCQTREITVEAYVTNLLYIRSIEIRILTNTSTDTNSFFLSFFLKIYIVRNNRILVKQMYQTLSQLERYDHN